MPRSTSPPSSCAALLIAFLPVLAAAQHPAGGWLARCESGRQSGDQSRHCELREQAIPAPSTLDVDGRENGGIAVHGWDKQEVFVRSRIQAYAETPAEAKAIASQITIEVRDGQIRAKGPTDHHGESWSVSFDIYVPRRTNLTLRASNGGLTVVDVGGKMDLGTVNGGLEMAHVEGDVRGETENGGVNVTLDGDRWRGAGLDLRTTNGGVSLTVPPNYSANLETGTTNGALRVDFPITVQGPLGRRLTTKLGAGGPPIRISTVNGSVNIRKQ